MHIPVLLKESLHGLAIKSGGTYVDCTTNRAGHSVAIAQAIGRNGTLVCFDLDLTALGEAREKLEALAEQPRLHFVHANFRTLREKLSGLGIAHVDGVLADLGVSTEEIGPSGRGFSFLYDEPLLMTLKSPIQEGDLTAEDIVNTWKEETIATVLYGFADEEYSRRIARAIVVYREKSRITSTFTLRDIVRGAVPVSYLHRPINPATKTFQALRMAVNDELGAIQDLVDALPSVLSPKGRAAIITFHSTEDRLVKKTLLSHKESLANITKKPITPSEQEVSTNPRSRSAKLRITERL